MTGGLESIALAVAHLEASGAFDRVSDDSQDSRHGAVQAPTPPPEGKLSPSSQSSPLSYSAAHVSDSSIASHAAVKHCTILPRRMALSSTPRVVSGDHSLYAQSCVEGNAFHPAIFSSRDNNSEENLQADKNTTFQDADVSPFSFERSQYNNQATDSICYIVPNSCPSASPHDEFKPNLGSMKKVEDMLFSLDLRELKTLAGPDVNEVIPFVRQDDVLCGRGGETNHHAGNIQYRQFVKACQRAYIQAKRRDKPFIAKRVVLAVRKLGGRFLKKDSSTNTWRDVGNTKAREKTSQALREGAPELRVGEELCESTAGTSVCQGNVSDLKNFQIFRNEDGSYCNLEVATITGSTTTSNHKKKRRVVEGHGVDTVVHLLAPDRREALGNESNWEIAFSNDRTSLSLAAPVTFAAAVSADDEEASTPIIGDRKDEFGLSKSNTNSIQGPRLKLLKRRLESEICGDV